MSEALDIARDLIEHGIPVFTAKAALDRSGVWDSAAGTGNTGYVLPTGWHATIPDLTVIDRYRQGDALCAVMGHHVDGLDVDPRHCGDASRDQLIAAGLWPQTYGTACTPSGGTHELIAPLHVGSKDGLRPGLDVKGGKLDGTSRGFLFIAPTVRLSKATGELAAYTWQVAPMLDEITERDDSGLAIVDMIATRDTPTVQGPPTAPLSDSDRPMLDRWVSAAVERIQAELAATATWPDTQRDDRGRGWEKMQADAAYRLGRIARADWNSLTIEQAKAAFVGAAPTSSTWNSRDVEQKWRAQSQRGLPAGPPQLAPPVTELDEPVFQHGNATEPQGDASSLMAAAIAEEVFKIQVRQAARAKVDAQNTPPAPPFDAGSLADILARPDEPPFRVEGLIPADASTLIVAQRKTGKTTLMLNLARTLIMGGDFLGTFPVLPLLGKVAILNYEVSAAQLARWAAEAGIPTDRLYLVNLRGRRNPLSHPEDRQTLAAALRAQQVETFIVDPFGRAYGGKSQNDSGEVGSWLVDLDLFARSEVEATDLILAAHAGWEGERTRGASALEDWADSIITLTRDKDDDTQRYFKATGRDVDVAEDRLRFDAATRELTLTGDGSRKQATTVRKLDDLADAIVEVLTESPGETGYGLEKKLRETGLPYQKGDVLKAARQLVESGLVRIEPGSRNSKRYYLSDLPRPTPDLPQTVGPPPTPWPASAISDSGPS